jgi:hypothetical protein
MGRGPKLSRGGRRERGGRRNINQGISFVKFVYDPTPFSHVLILF